MTTTPKDRVAERRVRERERDSGLARIEADLLPDEAAILMKAIERALAEMRAETGGTDAEPGAADPGADDPRPTRPDALVRVAATYLAAASEETVTEAVVPEAAVTEEMVTAESATEPTHSKPAEQPVAAKAAAGPRPGTTRPAIDTTIYLHLRPHEIDSHREAELEDGSRVTAESFRRLACDAGLVPAIVDGRGNVLDVGRKTRTIPPALRRALVIRDRGCRFPGCTHTRFLQAHHIEHWLHGGATKLLNLIHTCGFHHRLVHEGGFRVVMIDGEPRFTRPDGTVIPDVPARPTLFAPIQRIERRHRQQGLDIGPDSQAIPMQDHPPNYSDCVAAAIPPPSDVDSAASTRSEQVPGRVCRIHWSAAARASGMGRSRLLDRLS
jgi:hypothetical protein